MPWTQKFPNGSAYVASQSSPEAGFGGAYLDMAPEQMPGFPAIGPKRPSWLKRILVGITLPLAVALPLAACASDDQPVVQYRLIDPGVPKALRSCAGAPAVPGATGTQRDVAHYVVNLRSAHNDCKAKLKAVDSILDDTTDAVAKQNAPAAK